MSPARLTLPTMAWMLSTAWSDSSSSRLIPGRSAVAAQLRGIPLDSAPNPNTSTRLSLAISMTAGARAPARFRPAPAVLVPAPSRVSRVSRRPVIQRNCSDASIVDALVGHVFVAPRDTRLEVDDPHVGRCPGKLFERISPDVREVDGMRERPLARSASRTYSRAEMAGIAAGDRGACMAVRRQTPEQGDERDDGRTISRTNGGAAIQSRRRCREDGRPPPGAPVDDRSARAGCRGSRGILQAAGAYFLLAGSGGSLREDSPHPAHRPDGVTIGPRADRCPSTSRQVPSEEGPPRQRRRYWRRLALRRAGHRPGLATWPDAPSARRTALRRSAFLNGFATWTTPSASRRRRCASGAGYAVISTTGIGGQWPRAWRVTATPSMPGMCRSVTTTSGASTSMNAVASVPEEAVRHV